MYDWVPEQEMGVRSWGIEELGMRRVCSLVACIVLSLCSSLSWAEPGPVIENTLRIRLGQGVTPAGFRLPLRGGEVMAPATLELDREVTPALLAAIESLDGVELRSVEGRPVMRRNRLSVMVSARGLAQLARLSELERVSAGVGRGLVPPLRHTTGLVGIEAARRTWVGESPLTGEGVVLADIDSSVDVFHPDFFAADGGAYDWLDVDEDGQLTAGVDAVDLDDDGAASAEEVLGVLSAVMIQAWTDERLPARPEGFDAGWDWLYADTNGDGERNYGPNDGFDDDDLAFGEPLFLVDDWNGDGRLGWDERLIRLGSSRIRAVYVSSSTGATRVYRRGTDLSDLPDAPMGSGAYGMPEAMHATGVLSIAAGGAPHLGRALTGFAPEAELLVAYDNSWDLVSALSWALEEGADVVLHEYAPWVSVTLDGSDALSALVDESTVEDDVIHVCPVGNTGGSRKHTMVTLAPGEVSELELEVPEGWGFQYAGLSFHWRPPEIAPSFAITTPGGDEISLTGNGEFTLDGAPAYAWFDVTAGGTGVLHIQASAPLPEGTWTFEVGLDGSAVESVVVHGFVQDEISGWGEGIAWSAAIATDVSNIGLPSTAERCLAVGATTGHAWSDSEWWFNGDEAEGEVRLFSGRGPRIDGLLKPDISAPDNPFAAFPRWSDYGVGLGAYWVFGGTSGAGPHVAGAAVLLRQLMPEASAEDVTARLLNGTIVDERTGETPNTAYGFGRVSLLGALELDAPGEPPLLTLTAPARAPAGSMITVSPSVEDVDGDPEAALIRWDAGYDGVWDGGAAPISELEVELPLEATGRYAIRAEVRDETGLSARSVVWVEIGTETDGDGDADVDADVGDAGGGDSDADGVDGGRPSYGAAGGNCACGMAGARGREGIVGLLLKSIIGVDIRDQARWPSI